MTQGADQQHRVEWRPWTSAIALVFMGLLIMLAQSVLEVDRQWLPESVASSRVAGAGMGRHIALRAQWGAALFVSTAFMLALAIYSAYLIWSAGWRRGFWALIIAAGILVTFFLLVSWNPLIPPSTHAKFGWITAASSFDASRIVRAYMGVLLATDVLLVCAIAALLSPTSSADKLHSLVEATRDVRQLLMLATGWLVSGVVGIALLHRMGEASVQSEFVLFIREVDTANTIFVGALYSLALAAVFVPAQIGLRRLALNHYRKVDGQQKWLEDNGFTLSFPKALSGVLAIFAPLIASMLDGIAKLP